MLIAILAGLLVAFAAPQLYRLLGKMIMVPMVLLPLALFVYFCTFLAPVLNGQTVVQEFRWISSLGVNLLFQLDGLSLFFSLLITSFGTLIMAYAASYLKGDALLGRFYLYLTLFMTAMLGVVLSANILCLLVFWEVTSISSYLLISYKHKYEVARASALQALLITNGGGLCLMAGLILLGTAGDTYSIVELQQMHSVLADHHLYVPIVLLVMLGAFTKSAQFPFHVWLPNAMAAPTPVSAYLHSATMVKAGVYLLARFTPMLGGSDLWNYTIMAVGAVTAVVGAFLALQQLDLKAILAYTTISALGSLITLIGIGSPFALQAMLVFLLAHALYKGALFMIAGTVDHATGTRDTTKLHLLGRRMPMLSAAAVLSALSMAGILPFFGFIGKELLYEGTYEAPAYAIPLTICIVFSGVAFVAVAIRLGFGIFFRKSGEPTTIAHQPETALWLPPLLLSLIGLLFGLLPGTSVTPLLNAAAAALIGAQQAGLDLALWHGFNTILMLTLLTIALGIAAYTFTNVFTTWPVHLERLYKIGPGQLYYGLKKAASVGAVALIRNVQNGSLRSYVAIIILTFVVFVVAAIWQEALFSVVSSQTWLTAFGDIELNEYLLILLMLPATIFVSTTRSRLIAITTMSLVGYAIALAYIFFGAPDLAATQFLIETLTAVLFVLVLHKLPKLSPMVKSPKINLKYISLSVLFGATMSYVMVMVRQFPLDSELKAYYGAASWLEAKGRNIVNVILVDFRAFDTLGEITVLAVAVIGIFSLLQLYPEKGDQL
ncbi:hydrogen gas-evolving membrane-bound hydrogenase subunit E [Pontibacter sp. SGAir0037]|uniref:hydrogen gas-evolving membrane-bound hydrogenase subunit E n=1 Tax=Pontibacter sp. SGAir0037 TaxID=2571030 RepID=UPI0010CCC49C|nr:hydrogen gas-evolving membrane-bound hydrogenase subunit E [Pontibacter sp. SGAir0037]QCR21981.1 pH homeostasis protein A [Pontibacter sp. SGAir0037]